MDKFKEMLNDMMRQLSIMEHRTDVPELLLCEVSFLEATIKDVDRRMNEDCNGYKEN